jgi:hypothetical protein
MKKTISLVLVLALGLAAEIANADFTFGTPTNLGPTVNSSTDDYFPNISVDGLTLYFHSRREGSYGPYDIWAATRTTTEEQWGEPVNLGPTVNSSLTNGGASISADELSLYFHSGGQRGGSGGADLWMTTRSTINDPWGEPVNLGPTVNSSSGEVCPRISVDGLSLFFASDKPGGYGGRDLWVTRRATHADAWGTPVNLGPNINTSAADIGLDISADGLVLFFSSERLDGAGNFDLWVTRRSTVSDPWGPAANLGHIVNTTYGESAPSISADELSLYFCDYNLNRPGGSGDIDLWQAPIIPVVDFNSDGIVDSADMRIMIDHWGTNDKLCDIGPTPFGDGIVDVQDLIVLGEHLFEEPGLIAYWKLDETEGEIAHDTANGYDGTLQGEPTWQPESGMVDGALAFDGIDDYVTTPFVLNPADGPFSVFAWIQGGAPGQVFISQRGGVNWLCTDSSEGNLMTELKASGRGATELLSQTIITDGNWHRVGFVWDGSHRTLYVDNVEVATDAQANLAGSDNGLYIGAGMAMEPGSFWSGLIDDVRIYNRAVIP